MYIKDPECRELYKQTNSKNRQERKELAQNRNIPSKCTCLILGKLAYDRDTEVAETARNNPNWTNCGPEPVIRKHDYTDEDHMWYGYQGRGLDAKFGMAICRDQPCNLQRIRGEMDAKGYDIAETWDSGQPQEEKEEQSWDTWTQKIRYDMTTPQSLDQYYKNIGKGRTMRQRNNQLQKKGIKIELTEPGWQDHSERWIQWYDGIYDHHCQRSRYRCILTRRRPRFDMTAMWALNNKNEVIGAMFLTNNGATAAYKAFSEDPEYRGIDDLAMTKFVEHNIQKGNPWIDLGIDTNFYGYQLSPGLSAYKKRLGYNRSNRDWRSLMQVINPERFNNPYLYYVPTDKGSRAKLWIQSGDLDQAYRLKDLYSPGGMDIIYLDEEHTKSYENEPPGNHYLNKDGTITEK